MPTKRADDLRGTTRLAAEATRRVTDLVRAVHLEIASGPAVLGKPLARVADLLTRPAYGGVKAVTDLVDASLDTALQALGPLLGDSAPGETEEALRAALNGVVGDYLHASGNPLATPLTVRVAVPGDTLLVLLHGSSMNELQWRRDGQELGEALAQAFGCGLAYVRYNSGRHISLNGALLSAELEKLEARRLILIGHSMGGLVARAALHVGQDSAWRKKVAALVTLGSPHHGAPLERGGSWIHALIGVSRYSAPFAQLARLRGEGVTDLRYGNVRDEDWAGRNRFTPGGDPRVPLPLPRGLPCFAVAATTSAAGEPQPAGDGLVPVDSALGRHANAGFNLDFPEGHTLLLHGASHLDLLSRVEVLEALKGWLAPLASATARE